MTGTHEIIFSKEGTTQGDPLAMLFYGTSVLPLIERIKNSALYTQSWYADDSGALGQLEHLAKWLELLIAEGPKFGYFPEPSKSYLVIDSQYLQEAHRLFDNFGVKVVEGHRFLGGFVGSEMGKSTFTLKKIHEWEECLFRLSSVAKTQPQAALIALTKSLQCEWNFLHRVVADTTNVFEPIEKMLRETFIPALLGVTNISDTDRRLFSLPAKKRWVRN